MKKWKMDFTMYDTFNVIVLKIKIIFFFLLVELEDMFKTRFNLIWKLITLKMKKFNNRV